MVQQSADRVCAVVDHAAQTPWSDPGQWAGLLDKVKPTPDAVSAVARNIIVHYRSTKHQLPAEGLPDISLRWVTAILDADQTRHAAPLSVDRSPEARVQGCCRDHSLLAIAALRHHGVPARSRVGFATYLGEDDWNVDHVVVEAWSEGSWRCFDPETIDPVPNLACTGGPPGAPFLTAAQVWIGHRSGTLDVRRFGVPEGLGLEGDWFVHSAVIREVAHRFGDELLLWDYWGAMHRDLATAPAADLDLVDEAATLLVGADAGDLDAEAALLRLYLEDGRLRPGPAVYCRCPTGRTFDIELASRWVDGRS